MRQETSEQVQERSDICSDSIRESEAFTKEYLPERIKLWRISGKNRGYRLRTLYLTEEMLKLNGIELAGKTVAVSGSGNVAIYATEKAQQLGAKVVTVSDSTGWYMIRMELTFLP